MADMTSVAKDSGRDAPPSYDESMKQEGNVRSLGPLKLDVGFAKSVFGILWAVQTVVSLIAYICVQSPSSYHCVYLYYGTYNFFQYASMSLFISSLIWYIVFLLAINSKIKCIPWWPCVIFWSALFGLFFLIGSILLAAHACSQGGYAAGAFFGFVCLGTLVIDGCLSVRELILRRKADKLAETSSFPQQPAGGIVLIF